MKPNFKRDNLGGVIKAGKEPVFSIGKVIIPSSSMGQGSIEIPIGCFMTPYNRINILYYPLAGLLKPKIMGKNVKQAGSRKPMKTKHYRQGLPALNTSAAGIDIGSTKHDVAISDGFEGHIVREFGTYTQDLRDLVNWLLSHGVTTVAIESTGV